MKSRFSNLMLLTLIACAIAIIFTGCGCKHEWEDATCTSAMRCSLCDETQGEPLGHTWGDATCTTPKTCSVCDDTEGDPLGHTWSDATCDTAKTCSICNAIDGEPLGHSKGEYVIVKEATENSIGEKQASCINCNKPMVTEPIYFYDITADEIKFYTNVLDTLNSLKTIHLNPDSIELLGAVVMNPKSDSARTIVYISYVGSDNSKYTDYFWKDIDAPEIKAIFAKDNYSGNGGRMPIEVIDLKELAYYEAYGPYTPSLTSTKDIYLNK